MEQSITFMDEANSIIELVLEDEDGVRINSTKAKKDISDIIVEAINQYNRKYKGKNIEY